MRTQSILGFVAAIALSASVSAGSITVGAPLISGDVSISEDRHNTGHRDLSPDQLNGISRWLDQHKSGWQGMVTPPSSEPVELEVTVKHNDGSATRMSIIARSSGGQVTCASPDQAPWPIGHFSFFSNLGPPFVHCPTRNLGRYAVRLAQTDLTIRRQQPAKSRHRAFHFLRQKPAIRNKIRQVRPALFLSLELSVEREFTI